MHKAAIKRELMRIANARAVLGERAPAPPRAASNARAPNVGEAMVRPGGGVGESAVYVEQNCFGGRAPFPRKG